jgi:hypothetical protein
MLFIIIMSNSNTFNNNLVQTSLDDAYSFQSFSSYINNGLNTRFSSKCIFCPCNISTPLISDGSFRQCNSCKKQFKAFLIKK